MKLLSRIFLFLGAIAAIISVHAQSEQVAQPVDPQVALNAILHELNGDYMNPEIFERLIAQLYDLSGDKCRIDLGTALLRPEALARALEATGLCMGAVFECGEREQDEILKYIAAHLKYNPAELVTDLEQAIDVIKSNTRGCMLFAIHNLKTLAQREESFLQEIHELLERNAHLHGGQKDFSINKELLIHQIILIRDAYEPYIAQATKQAVCHLIRVLHPDSCYAVSPVAIWASGDIKAFQSFARPC